MSFGEVIVGLGERSYAVVLAPGFEGLGARVASHHAPGRCFIITNDRVGPLHADACEAELRSFGFEPLRIVIPDGEQHKTLATWEHIVRELLRQGADRKTFLIALGGGVIGDMTGFAASTILRGISFIQVPTTLLAMVDASVGGKTGVNTPEGKNLVGTFYQPTLVWAPFSALATLPDFELRCGLGEVIKHAVIEGESELCWVEANAGKLRARDAETLARAVAASVRTKASIVEQDEREGGIRAVLNLGHTLGHAVESLGGYTEVAHGEAVGIGMLAISAFAEERGWLDAPAATPLPQRLRALLQNLDLPIKSPFPVDPDAAALAVGFDKKRARGMLTLVVPCAPGRVVLKKFPLEETPALVHALMRLG